MASSELEVEPDLKKAPPHVEGELLKQSTKAILGYRTWKKYFFIVLKDKLQYHHKREDSKQNKEPIAFIRMSQVTSITEIVFNGVPRKHHLNCGFSLEAFHPVSQQQITLNLLAETPEDMRYWVHALRYIKAYWSKMVIRETVLSEEQERRILDQILGEDADDMENEEEELIPGKYTLEGEEGMVASFNENSCPIGSGMSVFFADGSKIKVHLSPKDTTSDLLEKEEVKTHLTSSAANIWLVDSLGNDMILSSEDHPALFPGKAHKLFALDHAHRVLPVFYNKKDFECIVVVNSITAAQVINHHDISVQLDLNGVTNRGLFLKDETGEQMFTGTECPCEVLFQMDESRNLVRQPVGKLVIHNKSLGGGRTTRNLTRYRKQIKTSQYKPRHINTSEHNRILEEISEEEKAQSRALDILAEKKFGNKAVNLRSQLHSKTINRPLSQHEVEIDGEEWIIASESKRSNSISPKYQGLEDTVIVEDSQSGKNSLSLYGQRHRSEAMSSTKGRHHSSMDSNSPVLSPNESPKKRVRSRSKSPISRKLPEVPEHPNSSPLQRRGATRGNSVSMKKDQPRSNGDVTRGNKSSSFKSNSLTGKGPTVIFADKSSSSEASNDDPIPFQSLTGKGPTIRFPDKPSENGIGQNLSSVLPRARTTTVRGSFVDNFSINDSRSSAFGLAPSTSDNDFMRPRSTNLTSLRSSEQDATDAGVPTIAGSSGNQSNATPTTADSSGNQSDATPTTADSTGNQSDAIPTIPETDHLSEKLSPLIIDFKTLQVTPPPPPVSLKDSKEKSPQLNSDGTPLPINVTSPNFLKVILLQSSEASDSMVEMKPMDLISLSGVVLRNQRGTWRIQEGYNFHDELPFDCDDHTETFRLSGGIRAVYNHTHKRWHVLHPSRPTPISVGDDSGSVSNSAEYSRENTQFVDERSPSSGNTLYVSKKVIVTEIGSAFHDIIDLFSQTRDNAEKKRIGSDMTNPVIGHLVRGKFCSSIAQLLLDGLRPYRLQGIVQDHIWNVTVAFCSAAQSDPTSSLVTPAIDKLIFQPINSLRTQMKDNNVKFRTFVSLAMSRGMLTGWLEALPKQRSVLQKYYLPSSFLYLVNEEGPYNNLYQQMLLTLEPMLHLPFDLSIDFESQQFSSGRNSVGVVNRSQVSRDSTDSPSPSQNSLRPNVVIKTHAATGQRTSAGNIITAVWDTSPFHGNNGNTVANKNTSTGQVNGPENSRKIQTGPVQEAERDRLTSSPPDKSTGIQTRLLYDAKRDGKENMMSPRQPSSAGQMQSVAVTSMKKFGGSLFKKLSESLQQLNAGGTFTGTPRGSGPYVTNIPTTQKAPSPNPVPATSERRVKALYTNICDDTDELCFSKGDLLVVKEQINSEWIICSLGNKTGIVPMNYIKPVS